MPRWWLGSSRCRPTSGEASWGRSRRTWCRRLPAPRTQGVNAVSPWDPPTPVPTAGLGCDTVTPNICLLSHRAPLPPCRLPGAPRGAAEPPRDLLPPQRPAELRGHGPTAPVSAAGRGGGKQGGGKRLVPLTHLLSPPGRGQPPGRWGGSSPPRCSCAPRGRSWQRGGGRGGGGKPVAVSSVGLWC